MSKYVLVPAIIERLNLYMVISPYLQAPLGTRPHDPWEQRVLPVLLVRLIASLVVVVVVELALRWRKSDSCTKPG